MPSSSWRLLLRVLLVFSYSLVWVLVLVAMCFRQGDVLACKERYFMQDVYIIIIKYVNKNIEDAEKKNPARRPALRGFLAGLSCPLLAIDPVFI